MGNDWLARNQSRYGCSNIGQVWSFGFGAFLARQSRRRRCASRVPILDDQRKLCHLGIARLLSVTTGVRIFVASFDTALWFQPRNTQTGSQCVWGRRNATPLESTGSQFKRPFAIAPILWHWCGGCGGNLWNFNLSVKQVGRGEHFGESAQKWRHQESVHGSGCCKDDHWHENARLLVVWRVGRTRKPGRILGSHGVNQVCHD